MGKNIFCYLRNRTKNKTHLVGLIVISLFFSHELNANADESPASASRVIVINFDAKDQVIYSRWEAKADAVKIRRWAQNRGLELVPDAPPVVDKQASFVSRYGSSVEISGLDPNNEYTLYIDFVKYNKGNGGITSRLVISADGERLSDLTFGDHFNSDYYPVVIPRNLIYSGKLVILFEEFATTPGVWGIWDMILTDGPVPASIVIKKEKPEIKNQQNNIIEDMNPLLKKRTHKEVVNKKKTGSQPTPQNKKEEKPIVEPSIKDLNEPKVPGKPDKKNPDLPKSDSEKINTPKVNEPDIRD